LKVPRSVGMNLFISWSGGRSKAVAESLHAWLPNVIQSVRPWMSAADLEKGARWSSDIARHLQDTRLGIICLTPDNLDAPWILFEAGALSKTLEATYVCPYLFRVEPAALKGPLVQFQATKSEKDETRRLLHTINNALNTSALSEKQLNEAFEVWWPKLETQLRLISDSDEGPKPHRSDRELIEESLELIRDLARSRIIWSQLPLSIEPSVAIREHRPDAALRNLDDAVRFIRNLGPADVPPRNDESNDADDSGAAKL
jgi:hypothetical protein